MDVRYMKKLIGLMCTVLLVSLLFCGCSKDEEKDDNPPNVLTSYENEKGVGFMYPDEYSRVSGIAKVYGLAYAGEGWLEEDKGVGSVKVVIGKKELAARTYVKNKYWVRTFDTTEFEDGPLSIEVTAYDMTGTLIGTVTNTVMVDNKTALEQTRYFASPDGKAENDGTKESPWDTGTAIEALEPGDILFLLGGVYTEHLVIDKSGTAGRTITVMNYPGEKVELKGAGIRIRYRVEYVTVMGIDQSGLRDENSGAELEYGTNYIEFWDCSFNDNTYIYESIPENNLLEFGTGFHAGLVGTSAGDNRQFITVSHCEAKYNDVDGFHLSSIDHGRFQFLEAAWNPNHKNANIFQYKHANGFVNKNSEYEGWGFPSEDNVYLFCYSHHNGQDGWDIRSPHVYLFGCVTHDEAQAGNYFGGVGIKFWEYDYKVFNCINFNNNLIDGTGVGMIAGHNTFICGTAFYNVLNQAVSINGDTRRVFSYNNIFMDYVKGFPGNIKSSTSIFYGKGEFPVNPEKCLKSDPMFLDPKAGNFFLAADSPALTGGNLKSLTFEVDGKDYGVLDGLGRPRASRKEIGPYTRYGELEAAK